MNAVHRAAEDLRSAVAAAAPRLSGVSQQAALDRKTIHGWTAQQVLGHLIDSAGNNLQRVVRLQTCECLELPGYDCDEWLAAQDYNARKWSELVELWRLLNLHLAAAMVASRPECCQNRWMVDPPQTLEFIATDYLRHLHYHLNQIADLTVV